MNSLDLIKMIESRRKTIAMLKDRIESVSAVHGYSASTVLQGTVKIARDRLVKVERELRELLELQAAEGRQLEVPGAGKAPAKR